MVRVAVDGLVKAFGDGGGGVRAVDDVSFTAEPGRVTGFLGPNGAGKTTTLRCLLGLVHADAGSATFDGRRYDALERPSGTVGAVLEASGFHPGRIAADGLRVMTLAQGLPRGRGVEALHQVGLAEAADRRVGTFSQGMRQRLALAGALLGEPQVLVLDEPANGLDPEGIAWLRGFLRHLAGEGRTVLLSSHVLGEVAQTVDDVVVLARGRVVAAGPVEQVMGDGRGPRVRAVVDDVAALAAALRQDGWEPEPGPGRAAGAGDEGSRRGVLEVPGASGEQVGRAALRAGVVLSELVQEQPSLEDVFLRLTGGAGAVDPGRATP